LADNHFRGRQSFAPIKCSKAVPPSEPFDSLRSLRASEFCFGKESKGPEFTEGQITKKAHRWAVFNRQEGDFLLK
jgi:hypothetical protein